MYSVPEAISAFSMSALLLQRMLDFMLRHLHALPRQAQRLPLLALRLDTYDTHMQ
jgi:hypothetical protein